MTVQADHEHAAEAEIYSSDDNEDHLHRSMGNWNQCLPRINWSFLRMGMFVYSYSNYTKLVVCVSIAKDHI